MTRSPAEWADWLTYPVADKLAVESMVAQAMAQARSEALEQAATVIYNEKRIQGLMRVTLAERIRDLKTK